MGAVDRLRGLVRRMGWGFGDQALSSLTNFALGILVARAVTAAEFGAFSLAFSTYLLVMGVSRAVGSEPLTVRFSAAEEDDRQRATSSVMGTALSIGFIGGLGVIVASFIVRDELAGAFLALGLTLPGLLTQDAWRFSFFAADRGSKAFVNDLVWTIVLVAFAGFVLVSELATAFSLVLAWGLSANVAAVVGVVQSGSYPRPRETVRWLREQRDIAIPFLAQFGALIGGAQLSVYAVASIAGLAAAGSLRAAAILLGPMTMFYRGMRLTAVPDFVRLAKDSLKGLDGRVGRISATLGIGTVAWGFILLLVPDPIGTQLLGDTWTGARSVLLPITLALACGGVMGGWEMGLRSLVAAKRSFRARVALVPLTISFAVLGAFLDGAPGAAWGQFAGMAIGTGIFRWHFKKALAEETAKRTDSRILGAT